jgi:hypothetical protein
MSEVVAWNKVPVWKISNDQTTGETVVTKAPVWTLSVMRCPECHLPVYKTETTCFYHHWQKVSPVLNGGYVAEEAAIATQSQETSN